jgi:hypothetical protein
VRQERQWAIRHQSLVTPQAPPSEQPSAAI